MILVLMKLIQLQRSPCPCLFHSHNMHIISHALLLLLIEISLCEYCVLNQIVIRSNCQLTLTASFNGYNWSREDVFFQQRFLEANTHVNIHCKPLEIYLV
jgi:hypothetical protein